MFSELVKEYQNSVIPAKAGIQNTRRPATFARIMDRFTGALDSRLRGNDAALSEAPSGSVEAFPANSMRSL